MEYNFFNGVRLVDRNVTYNTVGSVSFHETMQDLVPVPDLVLHLLEDWKGVRILLEVGLKQV